MANRQFEPNRAPITGIRAGNTQKVKEQLNEIAGREFEPQREPVTGIAPGNTERMKQQWLEAANREFKPQRKPIKVIPAGNTARLREIFEKGARKPFVPKRRPVTGIQPGNTARMRAKLLEAANKKFEPQRASITEISAGNTARKKAELLEAMKGKPVPKTQVTGIEPGTVARVRQHFEARLQGQDTSPVEPATTKGGEPAVTTTQDTGKVEPSRAQEQVTGQTTETTGAQEAEITTGTKETETTTGTQEAGTTTGTEKAETTTSTQEAETTTGTQEAETAGGKQAAETAEDTKKEEDTGTSETEEDKKKSDASDTESTAAKEDKYALLKKDPSSLTDVEKKLRIQLLIQKYVNDWKKEKEEQEKELGEDMEAEGKAAEKAGETSGEEEEAGDERSAGGESAADTKNENKDDTLGKIKDIAGKAWGFISSQLKGSQNEQQSSQSSAASGSSPFGFIKSLFAKFAGGNSGATAKSGESGTSGLANLGSSLRDMFGKLAGGQNSGETAQTSGETKEDNDSGSSNLASSFLDMAKGAKQAYSYGKLARQKETVESEAKAANQYINARERYKQLKAAYKKGGKEALSKDEKMEMLKQRGARKRSKDLLEAMSAAQEHAKFKSRAGIGSAVGGGLGMLGGIMSLAGGLVEKFAGPQGQLAGKILGAIGGGLSSFSPKIGEFLSQKFGADKAKAANQRRGKEYLEEKAAKLLAKPEAQADHMNEDEAKMIVARRLGVKDPNDFAAVYKKLAERRADRILKKEEGYKEVLAAMGLPEDADKASILEALGVS